MLCTEFIYQLRSIYVCMLLHPPKYKVHSMYPQHVGPLQLLSGEECSVYRGHVSYLPGGSNISYPAHAGLISP